MLLASNKFQGLTVKLLQKNMRQIHSLYWHYEDPKMVFLHIIIWLQSWQFSLLSQIIYFLFSLPPSPHLQPRHNGKPPSSFSQNPYHTGSTACWYRKARSICSTSLSQKYPSPFPGHISPPTQKCTFSGVTHPPLPVRRHHHSHTHFFQALSRKTVTGPNQICNAFQCFKTQHTAA